MIRCLAATRTRRIWTSAHTRTPNCDNSRRRSLRQFQGFPLEHSGSARQLCHDSMDHRRAPHMARILTDTDVYSQGTHKRGGMVLSESCCAARSGGCTPRVEPEGFIITLSRTGVVQPIRTAPPFHDDSIRGRYSHSSSRDRSCGVTLTMFCGVRNTESSPQVRLVSETPGVPLEAFYDGGSP